MLRKGQIFTEKPKKNHTTTPSPNPTPTPSMGDIYKRNCNIFHKRPVISSYFKFSKAKYPKYNATMPILQAQSSASCFCARLKSAIILYKAIGFILTIGVGRGDMERVYYIAKLALFSSFRVLLEPRKGEMVIKYSFE